VGRAADGLPAPLRGPYGEAFTIRLAFDDAPLVLVWHPDAVRAVYAADPSVAQRGASPGRCARWPARARSSSPTATSTCASGGSCSPSFHGERIAAYRA
jgi:hypothetical protein